MEGSGGGGGEKGCAAQTSGVSSSFKEDTNELSSEGSSVLTGGNEGGELGSSSVAAAGAGGDGGGGTCSGSSAMLRLVSTGERARASKCWLEAKEESCETGARESFPKSAVLSLAGGPSSKYFARLFLRADERQPLLLSFIAPVLFTPSGFESHYSTFHREQLVMSSYLNGSPESSLSLPSSTVIFLFASIQDVDFNSLLAVRTSSILNRLACLLITPRVWWVDGVLDVGRGLGTSRSGRDQS